MQRLARFGVPDSDGAVVPGRCQESSAGIVDDSFNEAAVAVAIVASKRAHAPGTGGEVPDFAGIAERPCGEFAVR